MELQELQLFNFTNYEESVFEFDPKLNVITGKNGSGKTNLLDAIHYLCLSKSAFRLQDKFNIQHEKNFFIIRGKFYTHSKKYHVALNYQQGKKKNIQVNQTDYERISEHIGRFPAVLVTPYDTDLIREGSEIRRKFFDKLIAQTDPIYLNKLITHNQLLKQRNQLLKDIVEKQHVDSDLLDIYDAQLIELSKFIYQCRKNAVTAFKPIFKQYYQTLSDHQENVDFTYLSKVENPNFDAIFRDARPKDYQLQRTTQGTHRDDFKFLLDQYPIRKFGSQGQQKSFILALKLTQYEYIKNKKSVLPILMLDDIFDKLDEHRIQKLITLVAGREFGQIFMTDARTNRTQQFFEALRIEAQFLKMD